MTIHLLSTLKAHPQRTIAAFAQILVSAAHSLPRSNNAAAYPTERSFVLAHAKWRAGVRAQITAFTRGKERSGDWLELEPDDEQGEDEQDLAELARSFETFFMHVTDLLLGDAQAVLRESEEWTGAVATWGVLVEPGLKRDDLPCVACLGREIVLIVLLDRYWKRSTRLCRQHWASSKTRHSMRCVWGNSRRYVEWLIFNTPLIVCRL